MPGALQQPGGDCKQVPGIKFIMFYRYNIMQYVLFLMPAI